MAPQLKHFFDQQLVRTLALELRRVHPKLDVERFVKDGVTGLERLELTPRAWHLAEVMRAHLPPSFPRTAALLERSLGPELSVDGPNGMAPFKYLPHVFLVQKYGLEHFEEAMALQHALTRRFTAESSIRAYLTRYPEATLARLEQWTADPSVHVRRLVSEGTRPRLPWAPRLPAFQRDPAPVLRLLERLKDDPERYVRRSVANNLNDIAKDHPELVVETCRRWLVGASEDRRWIIQHACRTLVKRGHRGALELLGAGASPRVRLGAVRLEPRRPRIGERVRLEVELIGEAEAVQSLLVDFRVHFVKASGEARPRVFKLARVELGPGEAALLRGSVALQQLTTRTHHPGRHAVDLLVNGEVMPLGWFDLRAAG